MLARASCLSVLSLGLLAAGPADVTREGTGPRRAALDSMELTPFDGGLWSKLSAWSGDAVDASKTNGQVVLICTWSSWYQPSIKQGLPIAQKLAARFGDKGLVVVGVHHAEGWPEAQAAAAAAGVKFPIAHDATGAFREALKVDQDPDFYLIDRAGHLRYADVATASVEAAAAELVAEPKDKAADLPRLRTERAEELKRRLGANQPIRDNMELDRLPAVPPGYSQPDEERYAADIWPTYTNVEIGRAMGLVDQAGRPVLQALNLLPVAWHPGEPAVQGRVIVIYLWHPDVRESYAVFDAMDTLQRNYPRDLAVIGALTPLRNLRGQSGFDPNQTEETEETIGRKLAQFLRARNFQHAIAADYGATAILSLPQNTNNAGAAVRHPRVIIASSDGIIRYIGSYDRGVTKSWLDNIVSADPGVALRRRLDTAYIENRAR
ncbi:MAG: TlpA family protein disulfide reductase [Phycisphaerales bacterium]